LKTFAHFCTAAFFIVVRLCRHL